MPKGLPLRYRPRSPRHLLAMSPEPSEICLNIVIPQNFALGKFSKNLPVMQRWDQQINSLARYPKVYVFGCLFCPQLGHSPFENAA